MRKIIRIGAAVTGLVLLGLAGAAAYAYLASERKLNRIVAIHPAPVAVPSDPDALRRGKYLYESRGCIDCHGRDGAGKVVIDDGGLFVRAPSIVPGAGSPTAAYGNEDWVRAIRHGVKPDGRPALIMPSEDYNRMTDEDLGAMMGHIISLPPVASANAEIRLPLPVRFVYAVGILKDAAEKIDHALLPSTPVPMEDEIAHGAYVANMCLGCHGEGFRGGRIAGAPPDWPPAANLTPVADGGLASYPTAEAFAAMLRSGRRPDGTEVSRVMPFESLSELNDTDVKAMYAFFRSLPPQPQP